MMVPTGMFSIGIVARLDVRTVRRNDRIAFLQLLRCQDICLFAIFVFQKRMNADRFGSYSIRSTVAGASNFVRLKSMTR